MNGLSFKAKDKEPCQVCGKIDLLYYAPFPFDPDIPVCPECTEKIYYRSGCSHWEDSCFSCPLWLGIAARYGCTRKPFPLKLIGYDPNVTYVKPRQLSLL